MASVYSDLNADNAPEKGMIKENIDAVMAAMDHLFSTERDEIPFFLDFTAGLNSLLFKELSVETAILVYSLAADALERFERRIILDESRSSVKVNEAEDGYDIVLAMHVLGFENDRTVYRAFVARQE